MRPIATFTLLFALSSVTLALDAPNRDPPAEAESIAQLRAWVESDRGFGEPQSMEVDLVGLHLFVAWNCPFSGRNGKYSYAYARIAATGRWQLIDSSFFERPESMSHAYVDPLSDQIHYVGYSGRILKSVSLKHLRFR